MVGLGKLGLPVALAIESKGHQVFGYDVSENPYRYLIKRKIPYTEKDLQPLLDNHSIKLCDSLESVVKESDIVFLPVQTPHDKQFEGCTPVPNERADFDYTYLEKALSDVAKICQETKTKKTVAVISTCLPGTYRKKLRELLNEYVDYVYTPQFIAMGTVLDDYLHPEFNLIGVDSEEAANKLEEFYKTINDAPCVRTDITTAEGIKVSYNTWITAKTVIANSWGELSEKIGMNFADIKKAWDLSTRRIHSPRYTDAGMSDGGGCHPRDNIAMSYIANEVDISHNIWEDLMASRDAYEKWHAEEAERYAGDSRLIILGRAFKPETNIETGSPALLMASYLNREYLHVEDLDELPRATYFIATKHDRYKDYGFPKNSTVIDPFGYLPEKDGVYIVKLGR